MTDKEKDLVLKIIKGAHKLYELTTKLEEETDGRISFCVFDSLQFYNGLDEVNIEMNWDLPGGFGAPTEGTVEVAKGKNLKVLQLRPDKGTRTERLKEYTL